ncbi:MAG: response regulator [Nitrospirae bacterium]|nr:response regulator [Nitrospirota bacterium]
MDNKYRILIVDDEPMLAEMLKEGVKAFDHTCRTASSGIAALELLKTETFDLMLTDVIMPGMDGFVLTHAVKGMYPDLAVIVMTGFAEEETYERAITAGASDFIKKPFTIGELLVRIDRIVRDIAVINEMKKKHDDATNISQEMIAGLQEEASEKIKKLQETISELKPD